MSAVQYLARGERVGFTTLSLDHVDLYARWVNDVEVKAGVLNMGIYTPGDEVKFVEGAQAESARRVPESLHFTIHDLADDAPVGTLGLFDINWRHRRCELGIMLGERRGTGLGTDAVRLGLDWAFNVVSLNSVMLSVLDFNERGRRAYEKAGFKAIGTRREGILAHGRLRGELLMDALAAEFTGSRCKPVETVAPA